MCLKFDMQIKLYQPGVLNLKLEYTKHYISGNILKTFAILPLINDLMFSSYVLVISSRPRVVTSSFKTQHDQIKTVPNVFT